MVRRNRKNEEFVSDPHELLLSLVDMGSLDVDEALLACVTEMSDAECKRVLNSLSLPACCDDAECDDEDDLEVIDEPMTDDEDDDLDSVADEIVDLDDSDEDTDEDDEDTEECSHRDLEARLSRLERSLRKESIRRKRFNKH